jgi:hypothetical protein
MPPTSASDILDVWERGLNQPPLGRALEMLSAACPEMSRDALLGLSIGSRDGELFAFRERLFGRQMACIAVCPGCDGRLELTLDAAEVRSVSGQGTGTEVALSSAGYELRFRPPNSSDVMVASQALPDQRRQLILSRCLLSASANGAPASAEQLPAAIMDAVAEEMAKADPLADMQLAVSCACCGHNWQAAFDIVSFLWSEIEAAAVRLMHEIHRLASAYGWCEREILALSATRRHLYLAMVGE